MPFDMPRPKRTMAKIMTIHRRSLQAMKSTEVMPNWNLHRSPASRARLRSIHPGHRKAVRRQWTTRYRHGFATMTPRRITADYQRMKTIEWAVLLAQAQIDLYRLN